MPRPVSPEGPWVTVPVRVRASLLSRIDRSRGDRSRSQWMREAAETTLGMRKPNGELRSPGLTRAELESREPPPPAASTKRASRTKPPAVAPVPKFRRCTHPGTRSIGGFCKQCDALVLPGGGISG